MAIIKSLPAGLFLLAGLLPASAQAEDHGHAPYAWGGRAEVDSLAGDSLRWEARAWVGDDRDRLLLRSEGERDDGHAQTETWALLSHNVSMFWDAQGGMRADSGPDGETYAVLGLEGLAPYFFDTEAHVFVSGHGKVSLRLHQSLDLLLTRKLVLQPRLELNAGLGHESGQALAGGLRDSELGLRLRYELRREFAPYLELWRGRRHGGTADWDKARGEASGDSGLRLGLMLRF